MSLQTLRDKYPRPGGKKREARAAINIAIRTELPGGGGVLDLLEMLHGALRSARRSTMVVPVDRTVRQLQQIHDDLRGIAGEMDAEIYRRYDIHDTD